MVSTQCLVTAITVWTRRQENIRWIVEVDSVKGEGAYHIRLIKEGTDIILST